ncbi:MAG TPA: CvpA family protein [Verrucomicrobiae bacterium]|jgi:uncharacterized membrane protein required for colicin V production|nr:CvpA family protein [Verrucomicrobiae bacterium]
MSLWILAIVLLAIFGGLGFAKGAIRMSISFVGLILGVLLAVPLGRSLQPMMKTVGVTNPVWVTLLPPVIVFVLVYLIVMGLSFFVHHKVYLLYKYKHDDVDRIRWERMNRQVGVGVGMLTGFLFFLFVCGVIYAAGYLTIQISAEDKNPATINFINSVRQDMADTGFDKAAAKFQPAPKIFFEAADVLGMLYHNPLLQARLSKYPYFLSLGERPEFQEMATDKEYNDLIFGKAPVTQIIDHTRTQALLGNTEVLNYLKGTDLADLKEYLRTGKSAKYDSQEILGVWDLDKNAVLTGIRKSNPDIKTKELRLLKQILEAVPSISIMATPDSKLIVKTAAPAAAPAPAPAPVDPNIARYGGRFARGGGQQPPPVAVKPAEPVLPVTIPKLGGEGTWGEEAGEYTIALNDAAGRPLKGVARVDHDEMMLNVGGANLVFAKE